MNVLIIGGTRNVGFFLAVAMHAAGHRVTVLNRGITRDELPAEIERLHADRADANALRRALEGRTFDAVVDATLYNADEAAVIVDLLRRRTGHYVFLSSGQVYLVRDGLLRPFHERDYDGRLLPPPKPETYAYEEWLYGMNKRNAEDVFLKAARDRAFPVTTLRLPMVNGERDHFYRLYNYVLRLQDGGPLLVPTTPNYPLRHIYSEDVVRAIMRILEQGSGKGRAYNLSQDEAVSLEDFLHLVGGILGVEPKLVRVSRELLEANGFLPDCSPFSERWMSELDNTLSKTELGITYTPLAVYLERIVNHYRVHKPPKPMGYRRRRSEIKLAEAAPAMEQD
jgi:nucleoside-diphosphate-sugar epimerase